MAFCALYAAGMLACCLAAHPGVLSGPIFFLGLFGGVAVGSGGIKPNVVVLGAEQVRPWCAVTSAHHPLGQFDTSIPAQKQELDSYFNWYDTSITHSKLTVSSYQVLLEHKHWCRI